MSKYSALLSFFLVGLLANKAASGEVRLRAGVATSGNYSIDGDYFGLGSPKYDADYKAIPIGVTFIATDQEANSSNYIDFVYQKSAGDAAFAWSSQKPDFSRSEFTFTFGTRVGPTSMYFGYKQTKTTTDWPVPFYPDELKTAGLVYGFGGAIPIAKGAISWNAGIGLLKGEYSWAPGKSDTSNATLGGSLGVGYTYTFNNHFSLAADYKWSAYKYRWTDAYIKEVTKQPTITAAVRF